MAENRTVGGVSCFDVLAVLSDYVDGELEVTMRAKVELHLAGCSACTNFGSEFGAVVKALQTKLKTG